jgi:serine/threonine protein kinase
MAVLVSAVIMLGAAYWQSLLQLLQLKRLQKLVDPHRMESLQLEKEVVIGRGAFAMVTRATWHGCPVAVKRMLHVLMDSLEDRWAFYKEMDFMLRARHRNLVHCFGWGEDDAGLPFVVLQYVEGGDLRGCLQARPALAELVSLALDVARGMAYLHDELCTNHRDLKPENVLVERGPPLRALVSDFGTIQEHMDYRRSELLGGSSRRRGWGFSHRRGAGASTASNVSSSALERRLLEFKPADAEDGVVGTIWYLAPEHMRLRPGAQPLQAWSPAADAYSYGVILFEMLTQRPPDLLLAIKGIPYEGPASAYWRQAYPLLSEGRSLWEASGIPSPADTDWPEAFHCGQAISRECLRFPPGYRPAFSSIGRRLEQLLNSRLAAESSL